MENNHPPPIYLTVRAFIFASGLFLLLGIVFLYGGGDYQANVHSLRACTMSAVRVAIFTLECIGDLTGLLRFPMSTSTDFLYCPNKHPDADLAVCDLAKTAFLWVRDGDSCFFCVTEYDFWDMRDVRGYALATEGGAMWKVAEAIKKWSYGTKFVVLLFTVWGIIFTVMYASNKLEDWYGWWMQRLAEADARLAEEERGFFEQMEAVQREPAVVAAEVRNANRTEKTKKREKHRRLAEPYNRQPPKKLTKAERRTLAELAEKLTADQDCVVCWVQPRSTLIDCEHYICCYDCAQELTNCPLCRRTVTMRWQKKVILS